MSVLLFNPECSISKFLAVVYEAVIEIRAGAGTYTYPSTGVL